MDKNEPEVLEQIESLEKIAADILELKKQNRLRRPLVIEFCGSPKSGKTTCINSLNLFLKRNKFRSKVLSEKASICPIKKKTSPNFNIWTFSQTLCDYLSFIQEENDYDIILIDRGIFDSLCWFEWLMNDNKLSEDEINKIEAFILLKRWIKSIDLVYIFKADPEISMKREYANLLTRKEGSIMNSSTLKNYFKAIDAALDKYRHVFSKIQEYDTSHSNQNRVNFDVTKSVLEGLKDLLVEKIAYFDPKDLCEKLEFGINSFDLIKDLKLSYNDRDIVEESDYIQPIPITIITNQDKSKVYIFQKNEHSLDKDSPEKGKYLMWMGGHVREEDSISTNNTLNIFNNALEREIEEELGIVFSLSKYNGVPFLIYTPDTNKSKKHLAICYLIQIDDSTKFKLSDYELKAKIGNSKYGKFHELTTLTIDSEKYESWSQHIAEHVFTKDINDVTIQQNFLDML